MCFLNPRQQGWARGGRPRARRAGSSRCRVTEGLTGLVRLLGHNPAAGPGAQIAVKIDLDVTGSTRTHASSAWPQLLALRDCFGVCGDSSNAPQMQPPAGTLTGTVCKRPGSWLIWDRAFKFFAFSLKEPSLISKRSVTSLPSHLLQLPR